MRISGISAGGRSRWRGWRSCCPALIINYFGQGALLLANPKTIENPFFLMLPEWALLPMVGLATAATVIASQAVITGAYSITQQAIQLGLLPRLEIRHTSAVQFGQIYVPRVNWILLFGVLLLVFMFRSSSALAIAYGIAVTGTMVVTTLMAFVVIWKVWKWNPIAAAALIVPLAAIDTTFLFANLLKVHDGGWFSLLIGGCIVIVMLTWRRGARILFEKTRRLEVPLRDLVRSLEAKPPHRAPGTAVFLTGDPEGAPTALLHSLKHYKVLHERNVILTVQTADAPRVSDDDRVRIEALSPSFSQDHRALRLHGEPERAEGARHRPQAGLDVRHHDDVVLPVAPHPAAGGGLGHAALAGPAVHRARPRGQ